MGTDLPLHRCSLSPPSFLSSLTRPLLCRKPVTPHRTHPLSHHSSITCISKPFNSTQHKILSTHPHSNENPVIMANVPLFQIHPSARRVNLICKRYSTRPMATAVTTIKWISWGWLHLRRLRTPRWWMGSRTDMQSPQRWGTRYIFPS